MHADLSFSYLRFAEAASFDKKELRRSCTYAKKVVDRKENAFSTSITAPIYATELEYTFIL